MLPVWWEQFPCLTYTNIVVSSIFLFTSPGCSHFYLGAITSCKSTWDTVPYFGLNGLSMILCLWPPLQPFSKLLAIQDHAQNLKEQLWMGGGGRSVFYLTDLWLAAIWSKTGWFFRESVSTFLQLVVALGVSWELPVLYCKKPNIQQACLLFVFLLLGAWCESRAPISAPGHRWSVDERRQAVRRHGNVWAGQNSPRNVQSRTGNLQTVNCCVPRKGLR